MPGRYQTIDNEGLKNNFWQYWKISSQYSKLVAKTNIIINNKFSQKPKNWLSWPWLLLGKWDDGCLWILYGYFRGTHVLFAGIVSAQLNMSFR